MKDYTKFKAISPARAIALYASLNGGPVHTREIIALGLREGKIRSRAQHVWTSPEKSITEAWRNEPDRESYAKYTKLKNSDDVSTGTWWKSVDWSRDVVDWNFRRGRLHVTCSNDPLTRLMLKRVRLHSGDVLKLLVHSDSINFTKTSIKKIDSWRMFWHEVVLLALKTTPEGSVSHLSSFKSDDSVLSAITDGIEFEEDLLSDNNVEEVSATIASRQPFNLSSKSALEEINLLRKALKFKRKYNRKRPR